MIVGERHAYVVNRNFELIFGRLNHDLIPTMDTFRKFIVKQKHTNKNVAWLMMGVGIYIYFNEKRQYQQKKELDKLRGEIDELKGERIMR